jgi:transposase
LAAGSVKRTVRANTEGHLDLLAWSRRLAEFADDGSVVVFALEDCRHITRRLEADLLTTGGRVVRVPTRLMAEARKVGREPGKSDPIDAQAVALAALRHPELPVAELDGPTREVKLLSDHRRDLVGQRTQSAARCAGSCTSSTLTSRLPRAGFAGTRWWPT